MSDLNAWRLVPGTGDHYTIGEVKLGEGGYASVYSCDISSKNLDKKPLVLKIFKPRKRESFSRTQAREAMAMKRLRLHPNVMQAYDYICYNDGHTAILMDRMDGSLSKLKGLDIGHQKDILRQILIGLVHIHRRGYIHRDIKPDNILFKYDKSGRHCIKISDFGLARKVCESMTPGMMTVNYRAPEMTQKEEKYTTSVDIWGAAMVACDLYIDLPRHINERINTDDMFDKYTKNVDAYVNSIIKQLGDDCPEDFVRMLRRMLHNDPVERPSAADLLNDSWLKL